MACTTCPASCKLIVKTENGEIVEISGNTCPRGIAFAQKEYTDPERLVTSTVLIEKDGKEFLLPVRTKTPVSKKLVFDVMEDIRKIKVKAPVRVGEVVYENIGNSSCELIACKTVV